MIKKYSQEQLAEKVYVSRQTISNWETDKSYPDIQNLLLLTAIFDVSLDDLVKGDLVFMENELQNNSISHNMNQYTVIMVTSYVLAGLSLGGVFWLKGVIVILVPLLLLIPSIFSAFKIDRLKKLVDVSTFAEIMAFSKGQSIEQLKRNRQVSTNFFEKIGAVTLFTVVFLLICLLAIGITYLLK